MIERDNFFQDQLPNNIKNQAYLQREVQFNLRFPSIRLNIGAHQAEKWTIHLRSCFIGKASDWSCLKSISRFQETIRIEGRLIHRINFLLEYFFSWLEKNDLLRHSVPYKPNYRPDTRQEERNKAHRRRKGVDKERVPVNMSRSDKAADRLA